MNDLVAIASKEKKKTRKKQKFRANLKLKKENPKKDGRLARLKAWPREAFWTAGSLYVLRKDAFLRLSIGGSDSEETKLEHAKALAAIALKRL